MFEHNAVDNSKSASLRSNRKTPRYQDRVIKRTPSTVSPNYQKTQTKTPNMEHRQIHSELVLHDMDKKWSLESIVYHNFWQLWLVLGVMLMEINSNLFSRSFHSIEWHLNIPPFSLTLGGKAGRIGRSVGFVEPVIHPGLVTFCPLFAEKKNRRLRQEVVNGCIRWTHALGFLQDSRSLFCLVLCSWRTDGPWLNNHMVS